MGVGILVLGPQMACLVVYGVAMFHERLDWRGLVPKITLSLK